MSKVGIAECLIGDNVANAFEQSREVNPNTGEYKLFAKTRWTEPGDWVEHFPDETFAELLACGAIRLPTDQELTLRELSKGGLR